MLPQKSPCDDPESALFQTPLLDLIDPRHALVTLAKKDRLGEDETPRRRQILRRPACRQAGGAAALPSRLMFGLHYLKHAFNCPAGRQTGQAGWDTITCEAKRVIKSTRLPAGKQAVVLGGLESPANFTPFGVFLREILAWCRSAIDERRGGINFSPLIFATAA